MAKLKPRQFAICFSLLEIGTRSGRAKHFRLQHPFAFAFADRPSSAPERNVRLLAVCMGSEYLV